MKNLKNRLVRTTFLSALALVIGGGLGFMQIALHKKDAARKEGAGTMKVAGASIGGPFTLVDQNGKTVTEKDFAGRWKLIYFGFTYCPAICPTELQKITQVIRTLEKERPELAAQIQPLFITVDPERDTPAVMREYIALFHPRMIGLSGTKAQIDAVKKAYRIYASKVKTESMSDYTVDHSSFVYFMDPKDVISGIYRAQDDAAMVYEDVVKQMIAINTP